MRRIIGIVLIGLGVAALTLAVLLRTYAYPAVSKVTAEFPTAESKAENPKAGTTVSTGDGVQVFVVRPSGVGPRTDQITFTRTTIGDVSRAQGDYVFWETRSEGRAASVTDGPLSIGIDGICVHRVTGEAGKGCRGADYVNNGTEIETIEHKGLFFKFPFNTEKRDYGYWDGGVRDAVPAKYTGTEDIDGLQVYKFVQTIEDTSLGRQSGLPGVLFNATEPTVEAEIRYANTRTLWVEPESGVIIRGQEQPNRRFVYNGTEVPTTVGTIGYTPETVAANVREYKDKAASLRMVRSTGPIALGVIGALLLIGGVLLLVRGSRRDDDDSQLRRRHRAPVDSQA